MHRYRNLAGSLLRSKWMGDEDELVTNIHFCSTPRSYDFLSISGWRFGSVYKKNLYFFFLQKLARVQFFFLENTFFKAIFFPNQRYTDPPHPSEMTIFTWKMSNVLERIKNKFFGSYFFELWSILYNFLVCHLNFQMCQLNNKPKMTKNICCPSKVVIFIWKMRNMLKRMKNKFSDFYFLSYSRFCSLFSIVFNRPKMSQKLRNVLKQIFEIFSFFVRILVFKLWSILYFAFVLHSGLGWIHKFFCWGDLATLNPQFL